MSAIIPINDKYRIELDLFNWAVAKRRPRVDPAKKQWEQVSWHKTLQQAGEWLARRLVAEDDLEGIDEVIHATRFAALLIADAIAESPIPDSWREANQAFSGNQDNSHQTG